MLNNPNMWVITPDERARLDLQFQGLSPINGFVSGEQAKSLFTKSNLPVDVLGRIWALADYDKDGKMNIKEFCVAMHLIRRKLEGVDVPDVLPPTLNSFLYPAPTNFTSNIMPINSYNTMPVSTNNVFSLSMNTNTMVPIPASATMKPTTNPVNLSQNGLPPPPSTVDVTPISTDDDWTIPNAVRPRYRLQFNQQDRNKRGFLTGVEAKAIFVQSGLPNPILAQIWSLADIDADGNLTCDEFCIAMHLVEQARAGRKLPNKLPSSLFPQSLQRKNILNSSMISTSPATVATNAMANGFQGNGGTQTDTAKKSVLSGEDERRANYLKGQAELEKRRAILEEQMRLEEENRKAKEKAEFDRLEKIRLDKEQARVAEVQRQMEIRRKQELEREEQLRRATEEREKMRLETEKSRLMEMEKRRLEVAITEKRQEQECLHEINSKKGNLMDALANEKEKKRDLQTRIDTTRETLETYKAGIGSMREKRDKLVDSTDCLREELEAAKAELSRCQREKQNLELQLQSNIQSDPVLEQIKTVQALKSSHKEKIKQLDKEIKELEQKMNKRGQKLASNRNKVREIEKKVTSKLISDIKRLQSSVCEKKNAAFAILKNKKDANKPSSFDDSQIMESSADRFSAFKKFQSLNTHHESQQNREIIYYEALYAFQGRQSDELTFKVGDTVIIDTQDQMEPTSGWLYGWVDNVNNCGLFPEIYVKKLRSEPYVINSMTSSIMSIESQNQNFGTDIFNNNTTPQQTPKSSSLNLSKLETNIDMKFLCVAMYPYQASVLGDLNFQPGDIIEIYEQNQDWWKGFNRSTSQQGLFPSNYVKVVNSEDLAKTESSNIAAGIIPTNQMESTPELINDIFSSLHSVHSLTSSTYSSIPDPDFNTLDSQKSLKSNAINGSSTPEIAQVVFDFSPTSPEQLALQVGQLIHVREKSSSGWWKGEIQQRGQQRRIGWFPGHFVNVVNSSQSINSEASIYTEKTYTPPSCTTPTPMTSNEYQMQSTVELNDSLPGDQLITMYNYSAQNIDELSFEKNSIILLLDKNEPEWWLGRNLSSGQEGLFPVNYIRRLQMDNPSDEKALMAVSQITTQDINVAGRPVSWYIDGTMSFNAILTEDEKRRQFYIRELIETEKVYYEDLQEVHQVFYEPIKRSNLLSPEELKSIFLNWKDLIPNSYNFYMALKIRKDMAGMKQPIQCIGDILLSNFPNFIVYVRFCSMQNQAIAKLQKKQQINPKFKDLCEQCETNLRCQKMPMTSYFLKPMQRITKYKLLVENILKHTEDNHPDRSDMEEAVAAARSLCESVNEGVRERENSERLEWLQEHVQCENLSEKLYFNSNTNCLGHRKLLYSGTLYKAKSGKELVGFLCNDFLLLAIPQYSTGSTPFVFPLETSSKDKMQFKIYKKPIIMNQVMISSGAPTSGSSSSALSSQNSEVFTVKEPHFEHILKALSPNDRDKWVERLMNASTHYINTENSKRERSMSIRRTAGVGRLIVTIVEGINLLSCARKDSKSDPFCEASLGNQLHRTKVLPSTLNPKWNTQMQFLIKNIDQDVLCLTVYNKDYFAPNEFLGRIEVSVSSVVNQKRSHREPIDMRLKLMEIESGELVVKLDLALFRKD